MAMWYAAAGRGREPAKVYPASERRDGWVVEAPADACGAERVRLFCGAEAQRRAVQFADEVFAGARLFVRSPCRPAIGSRMNGELASHSAMLLQRWAWRDRVLADGWRRMTAFHPVGEVCDPVGWRPRHPTRCGEATAAAAIAVSSLWC